MNNKLTYSSSESIKIFKFFGSFEKKAFEIYKNERNDMNFRYLPVRKIHIRLKNSPGD